MKTKTSTVLCGLISGLLALTVVPVTTNAAVIEIGDLNFISDAGNASDGLAFLDMTYSDGLTEAAALTAAQLVYADARLAIASEFDDLFAAAGIAYNGSFTASDGFSAGGSRIISSGGNYDSFALGTQLGLTTSTSETVIWTDPDGSNTSDTTIDYLRFATSEATIHQSGLQAPHISIGWLIVSDSAAIPEPSRALLLGLGIGAIFLRRRR